MFQGEWSEQKQHLSSSEMTWGWGETQKVSYPATRGPVLAAASSAASTVPGHHSSASTEPDHHPLLQLCLIIIRCFNCAWSSSAASTAWLSSAASTVPDHHPLLQLPDYHLLLRLRLIIIRCFNCLIIIRCFKYFLYKFSPLTKMEILKTLT